MLSKTSYTIIRLMAKLILALVITIVLGSMWLIIKNFGPISYLIFILYFVLYYNGVEQLKLNRCYTEYMADWQWEHDREIELEIKREKEFEDGLYTW